MFFAAAGAAVCNDDIKPPPVIARKKPLPVLIPEENTPMRLRTRSSIALEEKFNQEKDKIKFEIDQARDRQISHYLALLERAMQDRPLPDKTTAEFDVIKHQHEENIEELQHRMRRLRQNFEAVTEALEKECVDDFLQSTRWNERFITKKLSEVKGEIRQSLDKMHGEFENILNEDGKSFEDVCSFALEKYDEFEVKVAEVKEKAGPKLKYMKQIYVDQKRRRKKAWWEWIILMAELLNHSLRT